MTWIACAVIALVVVAFGAIGSGVAYADPACTVTWTGAGSDTAWATPGNWTGGAAPTAADVVCLPAGASVRVDGSNGSAATILGSDATVMVNGTLAVGGTSDPSSIGTLALQNGALDGAGNVHVAASLSWSGGWMQGSGATIIDAGATGTIDPNGGAVGLQQRTLSNHGTLTIASGAIGARDGATLTNFATLRLRSESTTWGGALYDNGGAAPKLVNAAGATLVKDTGSGTARIQVAVDNEGAVEVQAGRLAFAAGGAPNTMGTWDASASGTSLAFDGGAFSLGAGAQLAGAVLVTNGSVTAPDVQIDGALTLTGGTVALTSSSTASSAGSLTQSGGTLTGAGQLDVAGALTWSDGWQSGTGATVLAAGAIGTIDAPGDSGNVRLEQRTLENRGTLTLAHGALRGTQGAVVRNTATLRLDSESTWFGGALVDANDGAHPQLVNTASGTVAKTAGTGVTSIGVIVQDAGTLDAQTGAFRFDNSNPVALADGAVLKGALQIGGSAPVMAGEVDATAADIALGSGTIAISSGKTLTARSVSQTGGTLTGAGQLTIAQALSWTDGAQSGGGTTLVDAGATASIAPNGDSGSVRLEGRTLLNHGTTTIASGAVRGTQGAVLRNTATLRLNSEATWFGGALVDAYDGAHPQLVNTASGTIVKTAGTGTTGITWLMDQSGHLDAGTGRFGLTEGGNPVTLQAGATVDGALFLNGGRVNVVGDADASGAAVELANGTISVADGQTLTLGTLSQRGGQVSGAGEVDVADHLAWSDGTMAGTGTTILLPAADGVINPNGDSGTVRLEQRTLSTRGSLTVSSGGVRGAQGATWRNSGTLTLNSQASYWGGAIIDTNDGARAQLVNTGTLRKTDGTGTSRVTFGFDNEGAVEAQSGRLDFGGGGAPSTNGTWSASGGAGSSVDFTDGTFTLGAGTQADGALRVTGNANVNIPDLQLDGDLTITNGTLNVTGSTVSHADRLTQSGGTLGGAGALALSDELTWTGGQMAGSGSTTLAATGTGAIDVGGDSGQVGLDHRTLSNAGTLTLANGAIRAWGGAVVRNSGTLNINSQATYWGGAIVDAYNGDTPVLVNTASGTIRKTAGTGTTTLSIQTTSTGTVDADSGPIAFPAGNRAAAFGDGTILRGTLLLNGAPVTVGQVDGDGAELRLSGGSLTTTGGDTATAGTLRQTNGTVGGTGALKVIDQLQFDGGQMSGTGVTELAAGAEGTITPGNDAANVGIEQRELRVSGSLTHVNGTIRMGNGAQLVVPGTLTENSESTYWGGPIVDANNGVHPRLSITPSGKIRKTEGSGNARLQLQTENQGDFEVASPNASMEVAQPDGVTEPCDGGRWRVLNGGKEIVISSGLKCLLDGIVLEGRIRVAGNAQVTAGRIDGSNVDLAVSSGTLNVTDAGAASVLRSLTMTGGTLTGAAPVQVVGGLTWTGGDMTGSGATTLNTGSINLVNIPGDSGQVLLDQRSLSNAGTLDLIGGAIRVRNAATIANSGTLRVNSESTYWGGAIVHVEGAPSRLLSSGTLTKSAGTGTTELAIPFDNQGTVDATTGQLRFSRGGIGVTIPPEIDDPLICPQPRNPQHGGWYAGSGAQVSFTGSDCLVWGGGTILSGTIRIAGAKVLAGGLQGAGALLYHEGGVLAFEDPNVTSMLSRLYLSADMTGAGDVNICDSIVWQGGEMSGSGTTGICSGGQGTINPPTTTLYMSTRTLRNDGHLTWSSGALQLRRGAAIENHGTFSANAEGVALSCAGYEQGYGGSLIVNSSAIDKDQGSGTTDIDCPIFNTGHIAPSSGHFDLRKVMNSDVGTSDEGEGEAQQPEEPCTPTAGPPSDEVAVLVGKIAREPGDAVADAATFVEWRETFPDPDTGGPGDELTIVLGRDMVENVRPYAMERGLSVYSPDLNSGQSFEETLRQNASFLRGAIDAGATFVNAGNDDNSYSPWLALEHELLDHRGESMIPRDGTAVEDCD